MNIMPGPDVDYVGDCRDLGQFSDASVDEVYASHIIEHLGHRDELGPALREIHRVMKPGGILRVSVPDLEFLSRELLNPHYHVYMRLRILRMIFGGQINEFDFHKVGFTFELMRWHMEQLGFREVDRVDQFELFDDASRARLGDEYLSLNVEARK